MGATLLAGSAAAWGAEPGPDTLPINVIAVQTADADDQAEALTKALRNAVRAMPGWALGEGDYSLEVLTLSLKCTDPPDANCQSRIADQIKADRYIWGEIQKKGNNVQGDLYLWVRGKGTNKVPVSYSANLTEANDDALRKIAVGAVDQLTGGPPKGGIHVKAGDVQGQVFVDGQPIGALQGGEGTFMLPSGGHRVTVKAPGYAEGETQVVVKPTGAPTEVTVALTKVEEKNPTNVKRIAGFAALGAGVAFGVVGLVEALSVNTTANKFNQSPDPKDSSTWGDLYKYRVQIGEGKNACAEALKDTTTSSSVLKNVNAACNSAHPAETLQAIFFPLAAVAGGVGIFLIATSGSSPKKPTTGFTFDPKIGPTGGKLDITYRW